MNDILNHGVSLPPEQQAIRDKCFHPSGTLVEFPIEDVETSIPARFEKIVEMYPDRVAVGTSNQVSTYAELNTTANQLARAIVAERKSDAKPIGILFEKGVPMLAAMLGALKAGKFFVLLDLSFPKARLAALLEDTGAQLLVTDRQNLSLTQETVPDGCPVIQFESIDRGLPAEDLRLDISPEALAFSLYTSGSTGKPKGVVWIHRQLLHQVMLYTNAYNVCQEDRSSLLAAGTGNAITNTFCALLNGAALYPFDVQKEGVTELASWLVRERISFCPIGSPLFRSLCETLRGSENFPDLRLIRLASESVYKTDVDLYKKHFAASCLLGNALSSSETGLSRTFFIDHKTELTGGEVPVGYAVEGKDVLLLDDSGREVGFNQVGEIVVKSRYLSPGYWRRPDLTEAKFKPNPQGGDNRLCCTGDLGLMLPDRCLIHKGRKDFRVKIRGYGVEIAEVEKVLREHSAVRDVIVVARENHFGESRLVAYFASPAQPIPSVSELRSYMKEQLPEYMIPSAFVCLESMPLTPNGKVDRPALPDPGSSRPELDMPFIAPRTPIEQQLTEIWAEVLCLDRVGIHDNFFDLGGHSLAASRVISRVIHTFQLELPVKALFDTPTVAEMAAIITQNQAKRASDAELAQMLREVEVMSEEEAQKQLAGESTRSSKGDGHE